MAYDRLDKDGLLYLLKGLISKIKTNIGVADLKDGSDYATKTYVTENGGKIDTISVNGTAQAITNKAVDLKVPTEVSELDNDAKYITIADVPEGAVASTTVPKMNGVAATGVETAFARGDHVHPSDDSKVDKVAGKGLSTNDFTDDYQSKLEGIKAGAEVNTIATVEVNGTALTPTNKAVNITVPTDNKSLSNGAGYQTASQVQAAINTAVGTITSISYSIVTTLPETGKTGVIYLISDTHSDANDSYDEYIWLAPATSGATGSFEKIGNTDVNLSGYVKTSELTTISNEDIDNILTQAFAA